MAETDLMKDVLNTFVEQGAYCLRYCGVTDDTDDEEQMVVDLISAIECLKVSELTSIRTWTESH